MYHYYRTHIARTVLSAPVPHKSHEAITSIRPFASLLPGLNGIMVKLGPTPVCRNVELLTMTIVPVDIIDVIVVVPCARVCKPRVEGLEIGVIKGSTLANTRAPPGKEKKRTMKEIKRGLIMAWDLL